MRRPIAIAPKSGARRPLVTLPAGVAGLEMPAGTPRELGLVLSELEAGKRPTVVPHRNTPASLRSPPRVNSLDKPWGVTIKFETNSSELEDEARQLAAKFEAEGEEVEVWGPIRKAAGGAEQVALEILKIYFTYEVGKRIFPRVDLYLAEWFTERPRRRRPDFQVELCDHENDLVAKRRFGPDGYTEEMAKELWQLYAQTEGRLTDEERNLVRAAADGIEILDAAISAAKGALGGGAA
jgi:hypothetical protein